MNNVVFLYRSLAYRNAAVVMMRKARGLPRGLEQRAARRYAMALRDLARTEAWLEGRVPDRRLADDSRPVPMRMRAAAR